MSTSPVFYRTDKPPVSLSPESDEQIKNENREDLNSENPDGGTNNDKNDGDDDNEADAVEDATQSLIKRCSSSVLFKANRMAALIIQQSPTLWSLPASLRSLLDSLVCFSSHIIYIPTHLFIPWNILCLLC